MPDSMGLFADVGKPQPPPQAEPGYLHNAGVALTGLIPGAVANVLPSPDAQGYERIVPGMASGMYSSVDLLSSLAQKAMGARDTQVMHLPGAQRASELSEGSSKLANDLIPHMDPKSDREQTIQDYAHIAGSLAIGVPEAGLAKLPSALARTSRVVLPGSKTAAGVGMGLKAGIDAVQANGSGEQPSKLSLSDLITQPDTNLPLAATDTPMSGGIGSPNTDINGRANVPVKNAGAFAGDIPGSVTPVASQPVTPSLGLFAGANDPNHLGLFNVHNNAPTEEESDTTLSKAAMYGLTAAAIMIAGPRIFKGARDLTTTKFSDASAAWHANPVGEAPLPGTAGSRITQLRQQTLDSNATMSEYARSIADTPVLGDQLRAKIGDINGSQAIVQRFQAGAEKGELLGQRMPSLTKQQQAIARLTEDQRNVLDQAMKHGDELDNRLNNMREMVKSGTAPSDAELHVRYPGVDSSVLRASVQAGQADPAVKSIMDTYKIQSDAKADMLVKNNMLTVGEGQRIKDAHTNYVPDVNMDGIIQDPFLSRNITPYSGTARDTPKVWELMDQHDFKLFKSTEENRIRAELIERGRMFQGRDIDPARPGLKPATLFEDSKNPVTGEWVQKTDGSSLAVRINGELQHVSVNNRQMLDALKGPPVQVSTLLNGMNKVRQAQQTFITGPGAVLTGHLFPLINTIRSAGEISVVRPAGMSGGYIDKALQSVSNGRLALRGDPTAYIGSAYRMLADGGAEASRAISHLLDGTHTTSIGSRMRAVFGNKMVDAMHDRAKVVYETSNRAAMRDRGLLNSAGFSSSDATSNASFMASGGKAFMPSRDMVPELFRANDTLGSAAPTYVHLRNLFDELRGIIGESSHSNFFALNKDNPRITSHQLNYELRQSTGDPGTRGAGGLARTYGATVPFGNVSAQEVARVGRSLHEQPIGTMLGYLTHYGTLAFATAYTAMLAGPDAVKHLQDTLTDHQRSDSAHFYVPGHPEQPIKFPIQIMMRAPFNLLTQMIIDGLGMHTHADDPDMATQAIHVLHDYFAKHVHQSTINGMVAGLSSGIPPVMPSGVGPAITALTGMTADPNLYEAYMHADKPINKMFSYDITGSNQRLPGQQGKVDPVTGTGNGLVLQNILSDSLGVFGVAVWNALKQFHNASLHGDPMSHAVSNIMQDYTMRLRDDIPGANLLWNTEDKLIRSTPLQQNVEERLDKMRPLTSWKGDMMNQGLTRKHGQQLIEPVDPNTPSDPTMRKMYAVAGAYMNKLDTAPASPMKKLADLRKQVGSLDRSDLSPTTLRSLKNEYEREIQTQYANTFAVIHKMEDAMSNIVGTQVDIRHIDWKKGPDQFFDQGQ